jgi:hypothetical protein
VFERRLSRGPRRARRARDRRHSGVVSLALTAASARLSLGVPDWLVGLGALLAAVFIGAWVFGGVYLDHPGFEHFVRLRVHASGRRIDSWCLGLRDPLDPSERVTVVDRFRWDA